MNGVLAYLPYAFLQCGLSNSRLLPNLCLEHGHVAFGSFGLLNGGLCLFCCSFRLFLGSSCLPVSTFRVKAGYCRKDYYGNCIYPCWNDGSIKNKQEQHAEYDNNS